MLHPLAIIVTCTCAPVGRCSVRTVLPHASGARNRQLPDVQEKLSAQGAEPITGTPEQTAAFICSEIARWAKVVKAANIRLD